MKPLLTAAILGLSLNLSTPALANPLILNMKASQQHSRTFRLGLQIAIDQGLIQADSPDHMGWIRVATHVSRSRSINDACLLVEKDPNMGHKIMQLGKDAFSNPVEEI